MSITRNYPHVWRYTEQRTDYDAAHPGGYPPVKLNKTLTSTSTVTYGSNWPDWKRRISLGLDATTSLTGRRRGNVVMRSGQLSMRNNGNNFQIFNGNLGCELIGFNDPGTTNDSTADRQARSKFLKHYISARNDWRGGNFLAEVRETLHALRHPVQSLYNRTWSFLGRVGKLKKVYRQDPRNLRKHIGDAYLGYTFGVKPLVSDINDATTAFNNVGSHEGAHDTHRVSGFGRNTSIAKALIAAGSFGISGSTGTDAEWERQIKTDNTTRYTAAIRATCGTGRQDLQRLGMDMFDIVPALWEGTYLSFLVDYFANVGECLDSWRLWDADVAWCKITVRNSITTNLTNLHIKPHPTTPFYSYVVGGNPGWYTLSQYVNRSATTIPFPDFHFQMPGFPDMRWLNVSALASQMQLAAAQVK